MTLSDYKPSTHLFESQQWSNGQGNHLCYQLHSSVYEVSGEPCTKFG